MRKMTLLLVLLALVLAGCSQGGAQSPTAEPTAAPTAAPTDAAQAATPQSSDPADFVCAVEELLPQTRPIEDVKLAPVSADDHVLGPETATLTLIEYSDYQCPYCGLAEDELTKAMAKYPDDIRLVFRNFPLPSHDKAQLASQAAEAAGEQGKFWEMYKAIFAGNRAQTWAEMSVADFETWLNGQAAEVGLDAAKFTAALKSDAVVKRVQDDAAEAQSLALTGTPSFFFLVDGKVLFTPADQVPYDLNTLEAVLKLTELQKKQFDTCPPQVIDPAKQYSATIKTEKGDIVVKLYPDRAPVTVNSFVYLAQQGYYNDVTFHRVLTDFVAQAGDPSGTGFGGPGYRIKDEVSSDLKFDKAGVLGMAKSQQPNTNGSQFFITLGPAETLNKGYTIFGEVTSGMDVVKQLTPRDPSTGADLPAGDKILSITVEEK